VNGRHFRDDDMIQCPRYLEMKPITDEVNELTQALDAKNGFPGFAGNIQPSLNHRFRHTVSPARLFG
jgi:hypothetical protein